MKKSQKLLLTICFLIVLGSSLYFGFNQIMDSLTTEVRSEVQTIRFDDSATGIGGTGTPKSEAERQEEMDTKANNTSN